VVTARGNEFTDIKGLHHGAWIYVVLDSSYDTILIGVVNPRVAVVCRRLGLIQFVASGLWKTSHLTLPRSSSGSCLLGVKRNYRRSQSIT
jgi:hypothetical protein